MLYDRTRQLKALELKLKELQGSMSAKENLLHTNAEVLIKKDHDMAKIQLELVHATQSQVQHAWDLNGGPGASAFDQARERETHALNFAKETVRIKIIID